MQLILFIYGQTGIDTGFFLGLGPNETGAFNATELEELESCLADLESQLADFFTREVAPDLEPPAEFGAGEEGEGTTAFPLPSWLPAKPGWARRSRP